LSSYRFSKSLGVLAVLAVLSSPAGFPKAFAQVNVLTNKNDNARDGQNIHETLLTSASVSASQFGKLYTFNVDGYVSAQPLYMSSLAINGATHNVAFVATQHDSVYAIDADTGAQLWHTSFLTPGVTTTVPMSDQGCSGITKFNEVGIVGTPVIDAGTGTMYVSAKTKVLSTTSYVHTLHALDITTGLDKVSPVPITGSFGTLNFISKNEIQRPGLLLSNDVIYIAFGSNGCDLNARGWVFAYNAATLQQLAVMSTQPDGTYGSSVWQGGAGPAADSDGNVYLSTANGLFDIGAGFPDLGDSVLKLTLGSEVLTAADYFTPFDQATLAANDLDLGSGGITILPDQTTGPYKHLLVTASKRGDVYLIDRDTLGGYNPTDNNQIPQYLPGALAKYDFGSPLYWNNGTSQLVYFLAHQDYLKAYSLSNGLLSATPVAQTVGKLTTFGLPVISANGSSNGIVWLVRNVSNVPLLSAYDATRLLLLYDSSMVAGRDTLGTVGHFATPTVANGRVFAGTQTQLVVYGLFPVIAPTGGSGQTGSAGTTLPAPLTITVTNPYTKAPISGVNVTFSDGGKNGKFGSPNVTTNSSGQASTTYTLPNLPQTLTITASSAGYAAASFTENGVVGSVASIASISGGKQVGTVGTTLPAPIVVKAKDAVGNAVPGAPILFSDGGVGGVFSSPNPVATDSNGEASIAYTLPTKARPITITVSDGSVSAKISAQSVAASPALVNIIQGNNQTAHPLNKLPKALIVSVTDQYGNGISGLTVNFTDNGAGGTLSNSAPVTTASGQVSVTYTTSSQTGTVTITASYTTLTPVTFTETVQ
jgi:hypothetical protein